MPIHSIQRCSKTFYKSHMNVGSSLWWSTASTKSPCHHFIASTSQNYPNNLGQPGQSTNCVRVQPHAYPQHMKVLKHILYIQHGFEKQSEVNYSLNHVTMPPFCIASPSENYPNLDQLGQYHCVRVHPHAYPQHMKLFKHFLYPTWIWEAVSNGPQTQHCHHAIIS